MSQEKIPPLKRVVRCWECWEEITPEHEKYSKLKWYGKKGFAWKIWCQSCGTVFIMTFNSNGEFMNSSIIEKNRKG